MFAIYVGWRLRSYTTNNGALPDKQVFLFFVQQASPDTRVGIFLRLSGLFHSVSLTISSSLRVIERCCMANLKSHSLYH